MNNILMNYVIVLLNDGSNKVIAVNDNMPLLPENAVAFTHINQAKKDSDGYFEAKQYVIGKPVKNYGWDLHSSISTFEFNEALINNKLEKIYIDIPLKNTNYYCPANKRMKIFSTFSDLNTKYCELFGIHHEKEKIEPQNDIIELFEIYRTATDNDVKNDVLNLLLKYKDKLNEATITYFERLKLLLEKKAIELEKTLIKSGATITDGGYEFYEVFEPVDANEHYKNCLNYGLVLNKTKEAVKALDILLNQEELKR